MDYEKTKHKEISPDGDTVTKGYVIFLVQRKLKGDLRL